MDPQIYRSIHGPHVKFDIKQSPTETSVRTAASQASLDNPNINDNAQLNFTFILNSILSGQVPGQATTSIAISPINPSLQAEPINQST